MKYVNGCFCEWVCYMEKKSISDLSDQKKNKRTHCLQSSRLTRMAVLLSSIRVSDTSKWPSSTTFCRTMRKVPINLQTEEVRSDSCVKERSNTLVWPDVHWACKGGEGETLRQLQRAREKYQHCYHTHKYICDSIHDFFYIYSIYIWSMYSWDEYHELWR